MGHAIIVDSQPVQQLTSQSVVDITQRSITYNLEAVLNHPRECYVEFSYKPRASTVTSHNTLCQFVSWRLSMVLFEESSVFLWETKWLLCEVNIITVAKQAILQLKGNILSPG